MNRKMALQRRFKPDDAQGQTDQELTYSTGGSMLHNARSSLIVMCALLMPLGGVASSAHADSPKPVPSRATPPAFDLFYQRDGDPNPGQFHFTAPTHGPQTWTGTPHLIVRTPDNVKLPTSHAPNSDSVIIPANPPTITFDLAPDGTLTRVSP
ncbi:MAG: hypothetical protein HQL86_09520 [Magnetococcales bacterium]|nr:hypothetical protein [Magnetococcales bacterium]